MRASAQRLVAIIEEALKHKRVVHVAATARPGEWLQVTASEMLDGFVLKLRAVGFSNYYIPADELTAVRVGDTDDE
jgi:hypothetical protein